MSFQKVWFAAVACGLAALALTSCASNANGTGHSSGTLPATTPVHSVVPVGSPSPITPNTPASSTPSSPSVVIKPAPSSPVREATVTSVDGKRTYQIKVWVEVQNATCADHAYGMPVIQYLTAHPCHGLNRLLATTVVNGKAVGFAQSSLGFVGNAPDVYQTAGKFAALERKDGTGSVNDLLREGYRLPSGPSSVPSSEAFDVESQDSGVTIVDAFYLSAKTPNNDPALIQMVQDIYLQF